MRHPFRIAHVALLITVATIARGDAIQVSKHPQLFLDDFLIARTSNLKRDVKHPTKHRGNPVIRQDFPWEKRVMQAYGTVLYEPETGKFRCWYMASEHPDAQPGGLPEYYICYAESEDGFHWTKPLVGDAPIGSHLKHNIVLLGAHGICVMKTPWDPDPSRRYKAVGGATAATSPDGIHWTTKSVREAFGKNDTCTSMVYWNGQYLAFVRNQEHDPSWPAVMRGVGITTSTDFDTWTKKESVLVSDEIDGRPWVQPHALDVTAYGDVLIGLLPMLRLIREPGNNMMGDMDVQLAVSRDGRNWNRVAERAAFMQQEKSEALANRAWDARFHPSSTMLVKDDVIYIYYYGTKILWGEGSWRGGTLRFGNKETPTTQEQIDQRPREYGIGVATLPADRFVSFRPLNWEDDGTLDTKVLSISGDTLLVNADLSVGKMSVELLDASNNVLPGFSAAESRLIPHDKLRHRVSWHSDGEERSIHDVPNRDAVAIRFILRNADFFAFQIK